MHSKICYFLRIKVVHPQQEGANFRKNGWHFKTRTTGSCERDWRYFETAEGFQETTCNLIGKINLLSKIKLNFPAFYLQNGGYSIF
jgi:hypothetical protein